MKPIEHLKDCDCRKLQTEWLNILNKSKLYKNCLIRGIEAITFSEQYLESIGHYELDHHEQKERDNRNLFEVLIEEIHFLVEMCSNDISIQRYVFYSRC